MWTFDSPYVTFDSTFYTMDGFSEAPAGAGRRSRNIYRITIDGEAFEFKTYADAVIFLEEAKRTAEAYAEAQTGTAIGRMENGSVDLPSLAEPKIEFSSRELRKPVQLAKRDIRNIYQRALENAEIRMLMEFAKRDEENEILWLM